MAQQPVNQFMLFYCPDLIFLIALKLYIYDFLTRNYICTPMKYIFATVASFLLWNHALFAQTISAYTTAQAHSHNDYEQTRPFYEAYEQQFGSVEADLFLVNDTLYTAHQRDDIRKDRTFIKLYLEPVLKQIEKNKGGIYPQQDLNLQLLIDLKTPAEETMIALVKVLEPHKHLLAPKGPVKIVVSGNTPAPEKFAQYPSYIYFDGRPEMTYTGPQLERIGLISQSFQRYSRWNGEDPIPEKEKKSISKVIKQAHDLGKKIRFWATPDNINAWKTMMALGADFLNTDKVIQMGDYLRTAPH